MQAPNANAFAEAWIASLRRECLDYFLCFSRSHLDHIVETYTRFYNEHRPHQGVGNRVLDAGDLVLQLAQRPESLGRIGCHSIWR